MKPSRESNSSGDNIGYSTSSAAAAAAAAVSPTTHATGTAAGQYHHRHRHKHHQHRVGVGIANSPPRKQLFRQDGPGSAGQITSTARFLVPSGSGSSKHDDDDDGGNYFNYNHGGGGKSDIDGLALEEDHKDTWNYALLVVLYTLQGIPMGLSASIPFLIQQKARQLATEAAAVAASSSAGAGAAAAAAAAAVDAAAAAMDGGSVAASAAASAAAKLSYEANAVFALCSWPFSLKLLWAPIVDACFLRRFGRRKSWLVPVQACAGALMVFGAPFVERQFDGHVGDMQHFNVTG